VIYGSVEAAIRKADGRRSSIGRSNEIAALVLEQPRLFPDLIQGIDSQDALVRMRAADAAEKASAQRPDLLRAFKAELLRLLGEATQQELRWHLAQMIPRLNLHRRERLQVVGILRRYLADRSSIVRTCALQALADLAAQDNSLVIQVEALLRNSLRNGTAAMKARSRKLLRQLGGASAKSRDRTRACNFSKEAPKNGKSL
jgi:HEAT repeat protein